MRLCRPLRISNNKRATKSTALAVLAQLAFGAVSREKDIENLQLHPSVTGGQRSGLFVQHFFAAEDVVVVLREAVSAFLSRHVHR